ncbi:MAG: glycosyltransferase family 87 protein, partial [Candidatus Bathyarchaeia archaeon]
MSTRLVPWALYGLDSIDFNVYYRAAQVWLSRGNPYANLSQLSFEYPPLSLPFFALFTYFGFQLASQLWVLAYFSMFAVALLALGFALKKDKRLAFVTIAALLLITSYPFLIMYQLGPIDLFLASLTVLSFVAERLRHRSLSAVILSIAALLKGTPVFLLIYFVVFRRDLRYLAWFLLSTIGIVGISLIIIPVQL